MLSPLEHISERNWGSHCNPRFLGLCKFCQILYHFENSIPHECSCSPSCGYHTIFGWNCIYLCLCSQDVDMVYKHSLVFHVMKVKVHAKHTLLTVIWSCNKILTFGWFKMLLFGIEFALCYTVGLRLCCVGGIIRTTFLLNVISCVISFHLYFTVSCSKGWWERGGRPGLHVAPGADDLVLPADTSPVPGDPQGFTLLHQGHHHWPAHWEGEGVSRPNTPHGNISTSISHQNTRTSWSSCTNPSSGV